MLVVIIFYEDLKYGTEFRCVVDRHDLNVTLTTQDGRTEVCARGTLALRVFETPCL